MRASDLPIFMDPGRPAALTNEHSCTSGQVSTDVLMFTLLKNNNQWTIQLLKSNALDL